MKPLVLTETGLKAVQVGRANHLIYRIVGFGDMPYQPFYRDSFWYLPADSNCTEVQKAGKRIQLLKEAGFGVKGIIVAHEAPKLLGDGIKKRKEPLIKQSAIETALAVAQEVIKGTVGVAVAIAVVASVIPMLGMIVLVAGMTLVDPCVILVLEDGTWLEVMTWVEP